MNRSLTRPFLATLCLITPGWASAQELVADYRRALTALTRSADVFATDRVESLDALRRAKAAFAPLAGELEPPLRRGLMTTFASAEAAIVNQSETDLRVQAAVLRGGFQRTLYSAALEGAASGDLPRARELLGILATDLGMAATNFGGATQHTLQTAFERRLAALSLTQLDGLGDDREGRYEVLAGVYSHIFLVQDSPRLPAQTQTTLLNAVQALVAGKPLAPPLKALRALLTEFERAARDPDQNADQASRPDAATPTVAETAPTADMPGNAAASPSDRINTGEAATGAAAEGATDARAEIDAAPEPTPGVKTTQGAAEGANKTVDAAANTAAGAAANPAPSNNPGTTPLTPTAERNPAAPLPTTATAPLSPNEQLIGDLSKPLLLASGVFSLVGFLGLLFLRGSPVPWRDTAVALLLLPAISEGVIALAPTVKSQLEPYVELPFGNLGAYSLFTNPLVQLVWMSLVVLATLCLMLSWRTERADAKATKPAKAAKTSPAAVETAPSKPAALPAFVVAAPNREPGAKPPPVQTFPRATNMLTTGSGFNWDEDF